MSWWWWWRLRLRHWIEQQSSLKTLWSQILSQAVYKRRRYKRLGYFNVVPTTDVPWLTAISVGWMERGFNAGKRIAAYIYLQPFTSYSEILVGNCNFFLYPLAFNAPVDPLWRSSWFLVVRCRMARLQYNLTWYGCTNWIKISIHFHGSIDVEENTWQHPWSSCTKCTFNAKYPRKVKPPE